MDHRARLPLTVLVAAAVLGLLTGVAAVAMAVHEDGSPPEPAILEPSADEASALGVLREWDARRSRAYARADVSELAGLYVRGSRTGAADRAVLRGYRQRGLRVTGMRTQLLSADVLSQSSQRMVLLVTDVLVDAAATGLQQHAWTLPRDRPSTRRVVLVARSDTWRVAEAYAVD